MMYRRTAFSLVLCLALGAGASAQESQRDHGARRGGGNNRARPTSPAPRASRAPAAPRQAAPAPRPSFRPPTPPSASRGRTSFPSRGRTSGLPQRGIPFPGWNRSASPSRAPSQSPTRTPSRSLTPDPRSRSSSDGARSTPGTRFLRPGSSGWSGARHPGDDARAGRTGPAPSRGATPSRTPDRTGFTRPAPTRTPDAGSGGRFDGRSDGRFDRRSDRTGITRPSESVGPRAEGRSTDGRAAELRTSGARERSDSFRRYGLAPRSTRVYRSTSSYRSGTRDYCSPYYAGSRFYLGFSFGIGSYCGVRYYYPWYHCGGSYAFFYSAPISYCYVPYGFYCSAPPVYVTRYVYVQDTYPTTDYQVVETLPPEAGPSDGQQVVDPQPAAGSPVAEKYLRDGSDLFREGNYLEAAKLFRLAALSTPENAAPYFAFSQALIGIRSDAYAAKVLRKAVTLNPDLVREPGDIVGVFKDQEEFERVMGELAQRADLGPEGCDARFLLAAEQYFSGDPKALEGFRALRAALPEDPVVVLFHDSAEKRFAESEELPPLETAPK